MVQKVRGLAVKVNAWVEMVRKHLASSEKLSMLDAKTLLDSGEKLNVNSPELRSLRSAIRTVRGWSNRVKRCNLEQGAIHVGTVKELIKEHSTFLIEMPDELETLKSATQNYCICRQPYSGFMIGCDECEEWYHGQCIGISESRADRVDKYVCVRCSVKNVYRTSASTAAGIIRKWTCRKDLKKSRQIEAQKHQRKVRKEIKDIEKLRKDILSLETLLKAKSSSSPCQSLDPASIWAVSNNARFVDQNQLTEQSLTATDLQIPVATSLSQSEKAESVDMDTDPNSSNEAADSCGAAKPRSLTTAKGKYRACWSFVVGRKSTNI